MEVFFCVGIKYSDSLKKPEQSIEYTAEMIQELDRCQKDIWNFLPYIKIIHPDRGVIVFEPYDFQKQILRNLQDNRFNVILASRQSGKALALDTPILKANNTWSTMGDIEVGDEIYGSNGEKTCVTFVTDIMYEHDCFEVVFDNGEKIIADAEHLWNVEVGGNHSKKTTTTQDLYNIIEKQHSQGCSIRIKNSEPLKIKKTNLPIDPYILGVWLGDGHSADGRITTNKNDYIELSKIIEQKYKISELREDKRNTNTGAFNIYGLLKELRQINLKKNKHIPKEYLFASIEQRVELLKGLMDTDGYCDKGGSCEFYQKNKPFIDDVRFLLTSLGIKSRVNVKVINGEKYYTIPFTTKKYNVFKLTRKLERQYRAHGHPKNDYIYIKSITPTQSVPVKCIQVDSEDHLFLCGKTLIPTHNTTTISSYVLWYACFNADKTIGIVSNKQVSAIDIMNRIKRVYQELPVWMKPGIVEWSKTFITFENGTRIMVSATSEDAFRGRTLNLLCMDEFAFVPKFVADAFWAANYPTISASVDAKIVIISTPNGMFNSFHTLYSHAERGENNFKHFKSTWRDVPGRDEAWAENQRRNLGNTKFNQEYACEFLGSTNTVINTDVLEYLFTQYKEPILLDMQGKFRIYEKPLLTGSYVLGVDTAKGTGEHDSVIQVLKITSLNPASFEQVAVFQSNSTDVYLFADTINRISIYYNNCYMMVENNAEGAAVVNRLWWDIENGNLVNTGNKAINLGIRATKNTKPKAVLLMKKLIEDNCLKINDKETIEQLSSFIEENGRFFGKDLGDDLVSALYWAIYILQMDVFDDESVGLKSSNNLENGTEIWGILSDVDLNEDFM